MPTPLIILLSLLGVLLFLFLVLLFLVKPGRRKAEMEKFKNVRYAHRGLHGGGIPENSMAAFRKAVELGYGIELDVRLSSDGELVVFHDDTLDRMTGVSGRVDSFTKEELAKITLADTEEHIPTFREVLDAVDGKVPLLVELKEDPGKYGVTDKTVELLADYKGAFIVESFNPLALSYLKKKAPHIIRGFLSEHFYTEEKYRKFKYFLLQNLLLNCICRPDFIAYCHKHAYMKMLRFVRWLFRVPTLAWTTESEEEDSRALENGFSSVIFQYYLPETKTGTKSE